MSDELLKSLTLSEWDVPTKRQLAQQLVPTYGVAAVCAVLGLARSSYYHPLQGRAEAEPFERALLKAASRHPSEGSRVVHERPAASR